MKVFWVATRHILQRALWLMVVAGALAAPASPVSAAGGDSEAPALSASVDKQTVSIGDLVRLKLTFALPQGARLPETPSITGIEDLSVVEQNVGDGDIDIVFIVDRLESFSIDPIGLVYEDEDGRPREIFSEPVDLVVRSNLGDKPQEAALRPIQDILPTASPWQPVAWWIAGVIVLLGTVIGCLWWKKARRSARIRETPEVLPHVKAEQDIDRLIAQKLFEHGDVKPFYFNFSEIIRRYMGAIRDFPASEMTTQEIARHAGADTRDQAILPLLRQTDLVKFADTVPTAARKDEDVQAARAYIRLTSGTPAEMPEAEK